MAYYSRMGKRMGQTVTSGQKDSQENYNLPHDVDCYYVDTALKGSAIE